MNRPMKNWPYLNAVATSVDIARRLIRRRLASGRGPTKLIVLDYVFTLSYTKLSVSEVNAVTSYDQPFDGLHNQ